MTCMWVPLERIAALIPCIAPAARDELDLLIGELHALFLGELYELLGALASPCLLHLLRGQIFVFHLFSLQPGSQFQ